MSISISMGTSSSFFNYTAKATKAWHRRGKAKHNKIKRTYDQIKLPSQTSVHWHHLQIMM